MQQVDFEVISRKICDNLTEDVNLQNLSLYDSHIIELIPVLSKKHKITRLNLSNNFITDFGAMLLITSLKNVKILILTMNKLSENFQQQISAKVWSCDMEIYLSLRGEVEPLKIELANCSKPAKDDFKSINEFFNDYVEYFYHNPLEAKRAMPNFLMHCVGLWGRSFINTLSFDQIVARKKLPSEHEGNDKIMAIYRYLSMIVEYAFQVDRLLRIYKDYLIAGNKVVEELLLKEFAGILISVQECGLEEMSSYHSFDLICDIFDYFILRFNAEIDNSFFFGTSQAWNVFLNDIRRFLIDHIRFSIVKSDNYNDKEIVDFLKEVKARMLFTLHRDKTFRFLSIFSNFVAGRTQALIEIDKTIDELENDAQAKESRMELAWGNSKNISGQKYGFFQPKPIDKFLQLLSAIRLHDKPRVTELLCNSKHMLMNNVDSDGWGLIHHWAASSKVDKDIFFLLSIGLRNIFYDVILSTGWNAAFVIVNNNTGSPEDKAEKMRLLLEKNVDITLQDSISGKTPLHYAVETKQLPLIKLLCEFNREVVNISDNNGKTALDYSSEGSVIASLLWDATHFNFN